MQASQETFPGPSAHPLQPKRLTRVWASLERHLQAAPHPAKAAEDLRRALLRRCSGVIRSGAFFQARVAPLLARLAPLTLRRAVQSRYFSAH